MLCSLKHANIVTLRGVCVEGDNRCTIFDLAANVRLSQPSDMLIMTSSKLLSGSMCPRSQHAGPESASHRDTLDETGRVCRARCGRSWT